MAISTKLQLKSAIADWLNRGDLTARIDDFITLAEERMNDKLRARVMIARANLTADQRFETLPADFLEMKSVWTDDLNPRPITPVSEEQDLAKRAQRRNMPGPVENFSVIGGEIQLYPTPNASTVLNINYYRRITALAADGDANVVLTNHPGLYLYGALVHSAPFLKDDDRIQVWAAAYDTRLQEANEKNAEFSGGTMRQRHKEIS